MKKLQFGLILTIIFLGCGVPKDVYYSNLEKSKTTESNHENEPKVFSIGIRKDNYNKSRILPPSSPETNNSTKDKELTNKEKLNREFHEEDEKNRQRLYTSTSSIVPSNHSYTSYMNFAPPISIDRRAFIEQSKKYIGVRYKWGGTSPQSGFDCSGFVMNVFKDFGINSPRVSRDIALYGREVPLERAQIGDLIFFTGRNHASGVIGHIGIIVKTSPKIEFIHSATKNNIGVIISDFTGYYRDHFVKVMSVLK